MKSKDNFEIWLEELNNSLYDLKKEIANYLLNLLDFQRVNNDKQL